MTHLYYTMDHPIGPSSAVCKVSGHRCVSDCRSRVRKLIPARTLVEIDHEIISMVILLPSADAFKKGCCQLQVKVGVQWLSGRELDLRPRGRRFEPHPHHCVVSLSRT